MKWLSHWSPYKNTTPSFKVNSQSLGQKIIGSNALVFFENHECKLSWDFTLSVFLVIFLSLIPSFYRIVSSICLVVKKNFRNNLKVVGDPRHRKGDFYFRFVGYRNGVSHRNNLRLRTSRVPSFVHCSTGRVRTDTMFRCHVSCIGNSGFSCKKKL